MNQDDILAAEIQSIPPPPHLTPETAAALRLPLDERIAFARRDLWIGHAAAEAALRKLEDMLAHPRVEQMPCLLVAAHSRNGKSTILKRFSYLHPLRFESDHKPTLPVLRMSMPKLPKEAAFWSKMLSAMKVTHRPNDKSAVLEAQATGNLVAYRCGMLLIDEIHNVLQGTISDQKAFLVLLKNLTNELMIPITVAGTQDAVRTLSTDAQFQGRFDVAPLPRWRLDLPYRELMATLESLMPLSEPSGLAGPEIATAVFNMSDRTIGSITKIVRAATVAALRAGRDRITFDTLKCIDLVPLSGFKVQDL